MDKEAVEKKWDNGISNNLANLQGQFRNKTFLILYEDYNRFRSKRKKSI